MTTTTQATAAASTIDLNLQRSNIQCSRWLRINPVEAMGKSRFKQSTGSVDFSVFFLIVRSLF